MNMNMTTTQPTKKLVRDLEVGDVIHRADFDLNEECTHVTIAEINPYGTSSHSLILMGDYVWSPDHAFSHACRQGVFDKMTKVRIVKHNG